MAIHRNYHGNNEILVKIQEREQVVDIIADQLKIEGYRLMPSTKKQIITFLRQGSKTRTKTKTKIITSNQEMMKCASALVVAGIKVSKDKKITVNDIEKGWVTLRRCPGNLPPPLCMRRSIIEQDSTLRNELVGYSSLVDLVLQKGTK